MWELIQSVFLLCWVSNLGHAFTLETKTCRKWKSKIRNWSVNVTACISCYLSLTVVNELCQPPESVGSCELKETGSDSTLKEISHNFFCQSVQNTVTNSFQEIFMNSLKVSMQIVTLESLTNMVTFWKFEPFPLIFNTFNYYFTVQKWLSPKAPWVAPVSV